MKKILITGGSGLIGREVTKLLKNEGKEIAWLSRDPDKYNQKTFFWDPKNNQIDQEAIGWCEGIIHLAGEGVADKRWTEERKKEIMDSRILSTQLLFNEIKKRDTKPNTIISASAVGYYGMDTGDRLIYEGDPAGSDFLAEVVKNWEAEAKKFYTLGIRVVKLRTGIVLSKNGGALTEMMKPPVAAPLGNGKQYMSWIHIIDLARMYHHALENPGITGIYNAVGPVPVNNKTLTKKAAKYSGKPYINIGVPGFALKAALGEMAKMVLGGNRVSNEKISGTGFRYLYPELNQALENIYR